MDPEQFLEGVVRPVLGRLRLHSLAAERLIAGTVWAESQGRYLRQLGGGPALGVIQMEPETHDDIWENFLDYREELADRVRGLASVIAAGFLRIPATELIPNLAYAVAMCRVHYLRVPEALPNPDDIEAMGRYWKQHYNTESGKGTVDHFIESFPAKVMR